MKCPRCETTLHADIFLRQNICPNCFYQKPLTKDQLAEINKFKEEY